MSLVGFRARNHPQQTGHHGARPQIDDRGTSPEVFHPLHNYYGFTVDVAASEHNAKCDRYYTVADDGLGKSWAGERVWCNPPYSSIEPWVRKAWQETNAQFVVMLLPANRTEQGWWQRWVEPYRDKSQAFTVRFLGGRPRFIGPDSRTVGPNERPPFGVCLLIWDRTGPDGPVVTVGQGSLLDGIA